MVTATKKPHSSDLQVRKAPSRRSKRIHTYMVSHKRPFMLCSSRLPAKVFYTVDGVPSIEESSISAWGYLTRSGEIVATLERELDYRSKTERAAYIIGPDTDCDIIVKDHPSLPRKLALVHCRTRLRKNLKTRVVFYHPLHPVWINFRRVKDKVVELQNNDTLYFMDPRKHDARVNPCYQFVAPITKPKRSKNFYDLYTLGTKIGDGAFGLVYSGKCNTTGQLVAVKMISQRNDPKKPLAKPKANNALLREISVCMAFPVHPGIIQINRVFEENDCIYIVMEYGANGDLFNAVAEPTKPADLLHLQEYEVKAVFDQIAHSISYLHEQGIVHRDIKLENIIMCNRKKLIAKLCDFGLSTFKGKEPLKTVCGTSMYAAPELLRDPHSVKYGFEVDIWSLGVLLFTALTNTMPFPQEDETAEAKEKLKDYIRNGQFNFDEKRWEAISAEAKDLIRHMMCMDAKMRYTIQQVLKHPWLKDIKDPEGNCIRNKELVQFLKSTTGK